MNDHMKRQVELGIAEVRAKYPQLRGIAGEKHIFETIARFAGRDDVVPSVGLYELALENPPADNDEDVVKATRAAMQTRKSRVGKSIPPDINYANTMAQQRAVDEREARDRQNRAVFAQLLERHGLLSSHEANFQMLVDFCGGKLTVEGAEFLISNPPKGLQLSFTDERDSWIEKIIGLLHDHTERRFTRFDEQQERKRLAYKSRTELMARYEQLKEKQTLAQKSVGELKQMVKEARKDDRPYPGWPTLLSTLVPRGQIQAVNTRDYLVHVSKHEYETFKHMVKIYGSQQITEIMQGKRY